MDDVVGEEDSERLISNVVGSSEDGVAEAQLLVL